MNENHAKKTQNKEDHFSKTQRDKYLCPVFSYGAHAGAQGAFGSSSRALINQRYLVHLPHVQAQEEESGGSYFTTCSGRNRGSFKKRNHVNTRGPTFNVEAN